MDRFDLQTLRSNAKDARGHVEELLNRAKLAELIEKRKEDDRFKNTVLTILAVIGAVAAVAGIAYAVYCFMAPDYLEDYEDYDEEADEDTVPEA